jgi:hypothetical protein
MNLSTDPYVWIAAFLTLAVFSFLYADNPVFCFAEHLLVGLTAGYLVCITWHNVMMPELISPLLNSGTGKNAHLWIAAVLSFFWVCKFIDKAQDLYRVSLAFWVAIDMGLLIPTFMEAKVLAQLAGTVATSFNGTPVEIIGNSILALGTLASLTYFIFSREHKGVLGGTAQVGIWILMVGFGATFSYTILSRIYLLIGRIIFLLRDWLGIID